MTWHENAGLNWPHSRTGAFISGMEICSQASDPRDCYHNILITYKQRHRWRLCSHQGFTVYTVQAFWKTNMFPGNTMGRHTRRGMLVYSVDGWWMVREEKGKTITGVRMKWEKRPSSILWLEQTSLIMLSMWNECVNLASFSYYISEVSARRVNY